MVIAIFPFYKVTIVKNVITDDMSIGSAGAAARSQYASAMGTVAANSWDPNKLIKAAMDALKKGKY